MNLKRIYLACPYSHPSHHVRVYRFNIATRVAGALIKEGHHVFSPITHSHPIAEAVELPRDFTFWCDYDLSFLHDWANAFYVITLDGWEHSVGVRHEIDEAEARGLTPIIITHDYFHRKG